MSRRVAIYGLYDPADWRRRIRYVGKTTSPSRRLAQHIDRAFDEDSDKALWIRRLLARRRRPCMRILAWTTERSWRRVERAWIARGRRRGWPLLNETDGGDGPGRQRQRTVLSLLRGVLNS